MVHPLQRRMLHFDASSARLPGNLQRYNNPQMAMNQPYPANRQFYGDVPRSGNMYPDNMNAPMSSMGTTSWNQSDNRHLYGDVPRSGNMPSDNMNAPMSSMGTASWNHSDSRQFYADAPRSRNMFPDQMNTQTTSMGPPSWNHSDNRQLYADVPRSGNMSSDNINAPNSSMGTPSRNNSTHLYHPLPLSRRTPRFSMSTSPPPFTPHPQPQYEDLGSDYYRPSPASFSAQANQNYVYSPQASNVTQANQNSIYCQSPASFQAQNEAGRFPIHYMSRDYAAHLVAEHRYVCPESLAGYDNCKCTMQKVCPDYATDTGDECSFGDYCLHAHVKYSCESSILGNGCERAAGGDNLHLMMRKHWAAGFRDAEVWSRQASAALRWFHAIREFPEVWFDR